MADKPRKVIKLTKSQQRLLREIEAKQAREFNDVLRLIQDELGFKAVEKKGVQYMLNGDRSAFVMYDPTGGEDGKESN